MVETKEQLTIKSVAGILIGVFWWLGIAHYSGMATLEAIEWAIGIAVGGFLSAWIGMEKVSKVTLIGVIKKVLEILLDKTKEIPVKMLELELLMKQELIVYNTSWEALNAQGQAAIKTASGIAATISTMPGALGAVGKIAKSALESLQSNPTPPPTVPTAEPAK